MPSISNDFARFVFVNLSPDSPQRGPFIIAQRGTDPADPRVVEKGFVLTHEGDWIDWAQSVSDDHLIEDIAFPTVQEAMEVIEGLEGKPRIRRVDRPPQETLADLARMEAAGGFAACIRRVLAKAHKG